MFRPKGILSYCSCKVPFKERLGNSEVTPFLPSWSVCADVVNAWLLRNASSIFAPRDASQAQCWSAGHPRIHEQISQNNLNLSFQGAIQLHIVPNRKRLLKPKLTVFKTKLIQEANKHTYTNGTMSARNWKIWGQSVESNESKIVSQSISTYWVG